MEPLRNPVSGEENDVRIVKAGGVIWKDEQIAQGRRVMAALPNITFETSARHAVLAPFTWSAG